MVLLVKLWTYWVMLFSIENDKHNTENKNNSNELKTKYFPWKLFSITFNLIVFYPKTVLTTHKCTKLINLT